MAIKISKDPAEPNYARPEYHANLPDLLLIHHELGGTREMHNNSTTYIRKWKAERKENYDLRRTCEPFFEGLGRTLSAAVGMLHMRPPQIVWNSAKALIEPHFDNIDLRGTAFPVFAKRFSEASVRDGFSAILVDHTPLPKDEEGRPRLADSDEAERLNLRPVWTRYDRSQILNWQVITVNNEDVLSLVVLTELTEVPTGAYGMRMSNRYRVIRLTPEGALWELWELKEKSNARAKDEFERIGTGGFTNKHGDPAMFIPLAIGYSGRTDSELTATIPLLGVAWANLAHWQLSTNLRFNSEVAGFAQPTVIGDFVKDPQTDQPAKLQIGPLVTVHLQEGGDFRWTEPAGTGLERIAMLALEKLRQISALGVSFLSRDTRAAETAEAKRLDAAAENATLATAAQGNEDALNLAAEFHCWYMGIEEKGSLVITMSRDFENTSLAADIMNAYTTAVEKAALPIRLFLKAWQQGGRIAADEDLVKLEQEMMALSLADSAMAEEEEAEAKLEAI